MTDDTDEQPTRSFWSRVPWTTVARVAVTLAILAGVGYFLAPKVVQAFHDLGKLHGGHKGWLVVALLGEIASLLAFSVVTRWLIEPDDRPPFGRIFRIDLVTVALSHAVPAGAAAGTLVGYEMLAEEGIGKLEAGFVKVTQSLLSQLLLQLGLGFALTLQLAFYGPSTYTVTLTIVGSLMVVLVCGFAGLLARRPDALARLASRLLGRLPKISPERIERAVHELSTRLQELLDHPGRLAWVSVWSLGNWVFDLASLWAALKVFGQPPNLVLLAVAFGVVQVIASIPISAAGLGVVEGSLVPLLTGFGTGSSVAVLGTLAWRVFNFLLPLPVGGVAYLLIVLDRRRGRIGRHRSDQSRAADGQQGRKARDTAAEGAPSGG